jgi:hypothetical protein
MLIEIVLLVTRSSSEMMILRRVPRWTLLATVALSMVLGGGCGGGSAGGGGGGGGDGAPLVVGIRVLNVPVGGGNIVDLELWNSSTGSTSPNPVTGIPLNATIEIECAGVVDTASLPDTGIALGSINITTSNAQVTVPAFGTFAVSDAPNLPPGNRRIISFLPTPPTDPSNPAATAGFSGNLQYTIFIPRAGISPQVLNIAGSPVQNDAQTAFVTCDPVTNPGGEAGCFTDPVPGVPYVVSTTPNSSDPSPTAIDPATVANNTVTVFISEPLFPAGINLQNVRLINSNSGAQVPGSVQFYQLGTPEAGPNTARIDYIASSSLLANVTYELVISNQVADFGGNPVVLYNPAGTPPPSGRRFFTTIPVQFCAQPPVNELFDNTARRGTVTGAIVWDGSGMLFSQFPGELVGDGTFGVLNVPAGTSSLDTGQAPVPGYAEGNWNLTDLNVPSGANARVIGPYRVHLRCLGTANVSGILDGSAGQIAPPGVPLGSPEQGPRAGNFNDGGNLANSIVPGGVANAGGGNGGRGSQQSYGTRTVAGETGFGPTLNGLPNTGPFGSNDLFGGGEGGDGGCRFVLGGCGSPGELGGIGGAGGSAWAEGGDGRPLTPQTLGCMPVANLIQSISMATPIPPAMIFPISLASAGSGGGGGGDRFENNVQGVPDPTLDDQGGGAGGGGGGIRISAVNNVNINSGAALRFNGARGAAGSQFFGGGGGGGSGGEIWLESFSDVVINASALMFVSPGAAGTTCGDGNSGPGGAGLYQFEDSNGVINTNFIPAGGGTGGANINVVQFPFSTTITGIATSIFVDSGYGDPDYDPASVIQVIDLGANTAPGAMVVIEYQGAFETLSGSQPDLTNLSPWVTGPNLDQIDGYRYSRFRVTISYDSPNAQGTGTTLANDLPTVDRVSYQYSLPCTP